MLSRKITAQEEFLNNAETIGTRSEVPAKENIILLRRLEGLTNDRAGEFGDYQQVLRVKETIETFINCYSCG